MNPSGPGNPGRVEALVERLKESRKYHRLSDVTLRRVARWAVDRYAEKEALKAAKRKLHQVYGAYGGAASLTPIRRLVERLEPGMALQEIRAVCREILRLHTSTEERLPLIERGIYEEIFRSTGHPASVLDLACGLHPFALPWMDLPREIPYFAEEIDCEMVNVLNEYFERLGRKPHARWSDLLVDAEDAAADRSTPSDWPSHAHPADVAFLLKALPCLEQQEPGCSLPLLERIPARQIVISFPSRSLGGRDRGMEAHYRNQIEAITAGLGTLQSLGAENETFYLLTRTGQETPGVQARS